MSKFVSASLCVLLLAVAGPASAEGQVLSNDLSKCQKGPSTLVQISGLKAGTGKVRVQSYRASEADWMVKGRWINRMEAPARNGTMAFCVPLPAAGTYGIAVRHDVNGNGKTDISRDGGAVSNIPSINVFNLGKPSYKKVGVAVGQGTTAITINMRYM